MTRRVHRHAALRRLVHPDSIAIVGASPRAGAFGERVLHNLTGFSGRIFLVNARYERIGEHPCYPSVAALPEVPDCVVIAVAREAVEAVAGECAARGVGGVIVFASGYAEVGQAERIAAQGRLAAIARDSAMRIAGPNSIGIVNYLRGAAPTFFVPPPQERPARPAIGIASQSGALGFALGQATAHGTAVSHILTSGNSCDVDMADYVAYLAEEPGCAVIACAFEGMAEPLRLIEAAEIAWAADKPLIVHKMAVGEDGARAAMSHTGSLAGSHAAYRAALDRAGVIMVEDFDAVMETAAFFAKAAAPRGRGVAVAATSGGAAIMTADKAERHDVALPQPEAATRAVLLRHIPEFGSARNPCDVTAQVLNDPESLNAVANALLGDPAYAAMVYPQGYAYEPAAKRIPVFDAMAASHGKMICNIWVTQFLEGPGAREVEESAHSALFRSVDRCFATLAAWFARDARRRTPVVAPHRLVAAAEREAVAAMLAAADGKLGERAAKSLLARYGVKLVEEREVDGEAAAVATAAELGFPVALKIASADLPHKTEAGVVRLDLRGEAELRDAYRAVVGNAARAGARVESVLVQRMRKGVEVMVGARVDPLFGPLILVGLGGVLVGLLKDTALAPAPVAPAEAIAMLRRLKGFALLAGFRGGPVVDLDVLGETIARISEFAADHADCLAEFDVNPLICAGCEIVAVDALLVPRR